LGKKILGWIFSLLDRRGFSANARRGVFLAWMIPVYPFLSRTLRGAIPFAFRFHHARIAGLCCAFLFLEEASKPIFPQKKIKFKT
jgi:hypothetical protein